MCFSLPVLAEGESSADKPEKKEVIALKNNLLYDAAATPNLQLEIRLTPHWSLEVGAGFNPFPLDDKVLPKWRHVSAWIAPRYWFCHVFNRGYISANLAYAHYNVAGNAYPIAWMYNQVKDYRYQGDAIMAGASYGWHFAITPHFSIELEGGLDAGYSWYDQFECKHCGTKKATSGRWLLLPKLGVNISVPIGGDEYSFAKRCDCEKLEESGESREESEESRPAFERINFLRAARSYFPEPEQLVASVPVFQVKADKMQHLRSRLLRSEEEYEPYDINTPLSADPRNVFIFFDVDVTKMDRAFLHNDLLMDSIITILGEAMADSTIHISRIQIVGFASFDGRQAYNWSLAANRAKTIKEYMQSLYPLNDSIFTLCNGGESWAELKYHLQQVNFDGQPEVLRIIDEVPDLDQREADIKRLRNGGTYRYMRDELKRILRNLGCITIYIERNDY